MSLHDRIMALPIPGSTLRLSEERIAYYKGFRAGRKAAAELAAELLTFAKSGPQGDGDDGRSFHDAEDDVCRCIVCCLRRGPLW